GTGKGMGSPLLGTPTASQELHCPPSLSPPRPEDGGQGLSAVLGEHGEHLEAAMWQAGCPPHAWARGAVPELWRLLRIWDANKLSLAGPAGLEQCVFFVLSRMNHSCEPNVRLLPGGAAGELVAVAAVDISREANAQHLLPGAERAADAALPAPLDDPQDVC
ncbi:unnamed protein product, partial [Prorocentrum cordatum]